MKKRIVFIAGTVHTIFLFQRRIIIILSRSTDRYMDVSFLLEGLIIGFLIAAPIGPIGILCIQRILTKGWVLGLFSGLGAATADAVYGCIVGFGLTFVSNFLISQQLYLRLIGGGFLCFLGIRTFLSKPAEQAASAKRNGLLGSYVSTFFLTITNPMTIFSFAALFAGLGVGSASANYVSATVLVLGVFVGSALWWFVLSSGVNLFRTKFNLQGVSWINRVSGIVIMAFGLISLFSLIG